MIKERADRNGIRRLVSGWFGNLPATEQKDVARSLNIIYTYTRSMESVKAAIEAIGKYKDIPGMAYWVAYQLTIGIGANRQTAALDSVVEKMAACFAAKPMAELAKRLAEPEHRRNLVFSYLNDIIYLSQDNDKTALMANQLLGIEPELVAERARALCDEAWKAKESEERVEGEATQPGGA